MKYGVYSIQDVLVGFAPIWVKVNDEVAKREYVNFLKEAKNASDFRLFRVGEFDDTTGELTHEIPRMLIGGGDDEGNV